jgi:hypothetical protein
MVDCVVAYSSKLVVSSSMSVKKTVADISLFIQNVFLFKCEDVCLGKKYSPIYTVNPVFKNTSI